MPSSSLYLVFIICVEWRKVLLLKFYIMFWKI